MSSESGLLVAPSKGGYAGWGGTEDYSSVFGGYCAHWYL